ncbi:MAG: hypothetical protein J1E82_01620 [Muribaculaceae bacterium]|nr:hypothetical protein [Muribaculaceae bacterium]
MKLVKLLPLAAIACLMVSCENGGSSLSDSSTQTDSLMYYLGQMNASEYLQQAKRDTTLNEASAKQAYLEGVRAGLNALREGDDNYNRGVMMGMQMASNMLSFSDQMDVTINKSVYTGSLTSALNADTIPNMSIVQAEFRRLMTSIETAKKEKDDAASRETLAQAAAKDNLPKLDDDLYGKVTSKTDGQKLDMDNEVTCEVKITKQNGEAVSMPIQDKGKIGNARSFPAIVSIAMTNLKSGETGEFLTTAHALTNGRAKQLGLEPNDVLKMTIKATFVPSEEKKEGENAKPEAANEKPAADKAKKK